MNFRKIKLDNCYDSDDQDILNDFYIPALKNSCKYRRMAGFFGSGSLAVAAKGIQGLLKNNGSMKLIVGLIPSYEDVNAIKQGLESPEEVIEKMFIRDIDEIQDKFEEDHIKALAWMIANNKLQIKIAFPDPGLFENRESFHTKNISLFHQKVGIIEDNEGNIITFSGSENESESGWKNHIEEFKVFRSWIEEEEKFLVHDINKFEKFWNCKAKRTIVTDASIAIKNKLIGLAPEDMSKIDLEKWRKKIGQLDKEIILRKYQKQAIQNWFIHNKFGIFEMATGTGKTFTALGALQKLLEKKDRLVSVIACPSSHLIDQWFEEIIKFHFRVDILIASAVNTKWRTQISEYLIDIKHNVNNKLIILVTHDTFSTPDFIKIISTCTTDIFLVVDEMHGIGSEERKRGLLPFYTYRLGLSATPMRWYDKDGSEDLFNFFGEPVYKLTLKEAVNTINPSTGKTFLTKYDYKPIFVELTEGELFEYEEQTKKLVKMYHRTNNQKEKNEILNTILNKRANIIKNASNKFNAFINILKNINPLNFTLIYCTPQQIKEVQRILNENNIIQHKFTMEEDNKPSEKFGELSERQFLLKQFGQGKYQVLVAMNCLDEGVDVPPARIAIILASSGNPRQYIQRRGRVLRHYPGKEKAVIYDFIIKPSDKLKLSDDLALIEKKIFAKEISRFEEFSDVADNSLECLNKVYELENMK
jgi:superfamily II DNA or RNA helicase